MKYRLMVVLLAALVLPNSTVAQTALHGPTHAEPAAHVHLAPTAVPHQHRFVTFVVELEGSGAVIHGNEFRDDEALYGELRFAPHAARWFRLGLGVGVVGAFGEPHRRVGAIGGISLIVETPITELMARSYLMYEVQATTLPNVLVVRLEGQILLSDRFARRVTPIGRVVSDLVVPSAEDRHETSSWSTSLGAGACLRADRTDTLTCLVAGVSGIGQDSLYPTLTWLGEWGFGH